MTLWPDPSWLVHKVINKRAGQDERMRVGVTIAPCSIGSIHWTIRSSSRIRSTIMRHAFCKVARTKTPREVAEVANCNLTEEIPAPFRQEMVLLRDSAWIPEIYCELAPLNDFEWVHDWSCRKEILVLVIQEWLGDAWSKNKSGKLIAMASNLLAMASNLIAMASNLEAMAAIW